jgi:hypothetical protein
MTGRVGISSRGRCAIAVFASLLLVSLSSGCAKSPPPIKGKLPLFPVEGKLVMNGEPMANATILFHPVRKMPDGAAHQRPRAVAGSDGSFKVSTYANDDGAPAGEYKVTISWKGDTTGVTSEEQQDLPEKVSETFQQARASRIRIKINEEENKLPTWDLAQLESHASNTP